MDHKDFERILKELYNKCIESLTDVCCAELDALSTRTSDAEIRGEKYEPDVVESVLTINSTLAALINKHFEEVTK